MFKLRNLRIGPRLSIGFGSLLVFMVLIVAAGVAGLQSGTQYIDKLVTDDYSKAEVSNELLQLFNENVTNTFLIMMATDKEKAEAVSAELLKTRKGVQSAMDRLGALVSTKEEVELYEDIKKKRKHYVSTADKLLQLVHQNKRADALRLMEEVRLPALKELLAAIQTMADRQGESIKNTGVTAKDTFLLTRNAMIGLGVFSLLLGAMLSYLTTRFITRSTVRLTQTVDKVAAGDYGARVQLNTGDELGRLGQAFDSMLNDRVASLAQKEKESEALNTSIIDLLRAVAKLSKGDLTTKAPVREDITGALADAINAMADSTAKTLGGVNVVSHEVRSASQGGRDRALSTAKGMNEIRGTIQETGKRIKRLGERSQEITGIVKLIDDIAERTSVLALNANMQAAMAGEAGRGFRVVADEVQRLAERSKEATDQISKLVNNIQNETNDTMATMDRAISEVVKGGELAEQAAKQVTHLDELGEQLIASVRAFTLPSEYAKADGSAANRRAA
jgi:methyl-accepting chemotaxis protein